ncbi:MFS transporter [Microbispora cellulosiformans]|uniref:MFS transporter n=1 Tax=Microbispora cellulosiformans TaxID=2614688 RepID=A0A5J5JXR6_9ACTN|nr:MFS transporter [Microbispora cellulosiformans]KAA9375536.1 MFS transporter [Microbispora cellulosiformans]
MVTESAAGPLDDRAEYDRRTRSAVRLVMLASFMVLADVSIMNVAGPVIQRDLGADLGEVQLMIAVYQIAYASLLVTGGRLGDIYGRRLLVVVGTVCFLLASVACGVAQDPLQLIVFRGAQGASAALLSPQVVATIQVAVPQARRMSALSLLGAVMQIATIIGPLIAGVAIAWNPGGLSWRLIFFVNVPVCLVLLVRHTLVPADRAAGRRRIDGAGVVLVVLTLLALTVPLTVARGRGWPLWGWVMLAASPLLLAAFAFVQRRLNARGAEPLLPLQLWREGGFRAGVLLYLVFFGGAICFFLYYALVLQGGLGMSAFWTSVSVTPYAVGAMASSSYSRKLVPRIGARRTVLTGITFCCAGTASMLLPLALSRTSALPVWMLGPLTITGIGMGLVIAPLLSLALAGIEPAHAGAASGLLSTVQQVGGALGVVVMGLLFSVSESGPASLSELGDGLMRGLLFEVAAFLLAAVLIMRLARVTRPA